MAAGGPKARSAGRPDSTTDECAELRRLAEERCAVAAGLASQAEAAAAVLRERQRESDDRETRAAHAAEQANPRALRGAKEAAQHQFRVASGAAQARAEVEAAARTWLLEINRINGEAGGGSARPDEPGRLGRGEEDAEEADEVAAALAGGGDVPVLFRLLAGDHAALREVVLRLAGDDAGEQTRWQLQLSELIDSILARAIEGSNLHFPVDHGFWGPYTRDQARDIVGALASLGYRFDGLGGFADGRIPGQRDLSLAVGFAGLDPMRIRRWPNEAEMGDLFREVTVAADEYVAGEAPGLTLGEMVSMLGRRADGLADLWNAWGRIRPLLLASA